MNRKNLPIICNECGKETKVNGLGFHIKHIHNMTVDDYVEKWGEFRPKYIDYNKRASENDFKCLICNNSFASERHLSFHIIKEHGISKRDYIVEHILNGEIPKCKCGCGEEVTIKKKGSPPYWREYIKGHSTGDIHIGMKRSYESRMKMRKSAVERLKSKDSVFYRKQSQNELDLLKFVNDNYNGTIISSDVDVLSGKELDIYLPEIGLAIELNGDRFHSDLYKTRKYHLQKTVECNDLGVRLIHIWLCDWNSKRDIIQSQLLNFLDNSSKKINARDCEVKEVSFLDSKQFLEKNHLQGNSISKYRHGLYYDGELVQIITFGKLRRATGRNHIEGSYELIRLCSKLNTVVRGGASKLFNYFTKLHNPERIISFANRDWSMGNMYEKIGMNNIGYTQIGYFYSNGTRREHRYNYQKHKLVKMGFDENKSEYQIMSDRGYYRIWNTGNIIYEWNKAS